MLKSIKHLANIRLTITMCKEITRVTSKLASIKLTTVVYKLL